MKNRTKETPLIRGAFNIDNITNLNRFNKDVRKSKKNESNIQQ